MGRIKFYLNNMNFLKPFTDANKPIDDDDHAK